MFSRAWSETLRRFACAETFEAVAEAHYLLAEDIFGKRTAAGSQNAMPGGLHFKGRISVTPKWGPSQREQFTRMRGWLQQSA